MIFLYIYFSSTFFKGWFFCIYGGSKKNFKSGSKKKFKKRNNSKKKSKRGGGKVWKTYKEVDSDEVCPICLEKYVDTPTQAIYKTWCGHLFHNDCLHSYCELNEEGTQCPICKRHIQDDKHQNCMDVWAFKTKSLSLEDNTELLPEDMAKIYNDQIIL